jgi:uncharacterized membrane protein YccC
MAPTISQGLAAARGDVKVFFAPGPRMVDEIECAVSVLLAIGLGHLFGAQHISWAAFSGYMVMRGHIAETLQRGTLRILGTACGAMLAVAFVPVAGFSLVSVSLSLAVVAGLTLYAALTARHSYAWLFVGLTFAMVLLDQMEHPGDPLGPFAWTRVVEVTAGTLACVLVSLASTHSLRRRWPAIRRPSPPPAGWRPEAARHALQGAIAVAVVPWLALFWREPELGGGAVAIMAMMLAPLGALGHSALKPVSHRMVMRVVGCAAGAAFAAGLLLLSHGWAPLLVVGALFGVMLGRHIENGATSAAYAGTQFVLAVLITLVPDSYMHPHVEVGWARLAGTLAGIVVLGPILLAWHVVAPRKRAPEAENESEAGGI